jgi:hypothetical protein
MRKSALGLGALVTGLIAIGGCKTEVDDPNQSDGVVGTPMAGATAGAGAGAGAAGMSGAGGAATGTAGVGTSGAGGMTASGTGGMTASGTGGMTAAGTGGMTAAGTGGMTAAGAGGMNAGGMGGGGGADGSATCIANAAAMDPPRTGACTECGCMKCLAEIMNCQDPECSSVVACGQMSGCSGRACYCGTESLVSCAFGNGNGQCMAQIEAASGLVASGMCTANNCATVLAEVTNPSGAMYDASNPVSRANAVSICTRGQLASDGEGVVDPTPAITGMCETECMQ